MGAFAGLYLVTPPWPTPLETLAAGVTSGIAGGARLIQYREKTGSWSTRLQRARVLLAHCRAAGVPLVINDDVELAAAVGANGVHLGADDGPPRVARAILGADAIVGVSCYASLERALAAQAEGADYLAFGSFYPSATKPDAVRADPDLLRRARRCLDRPLVAIGGITPENGGPLIAAGADMLAVVSGVFAVPDVAAAARAYSRLFPTEDSR